MTPQLSVIVPAYNEAETLKRTLPELHSYLKTLPWTFELIVADDGSTDGTKTVVASLSKKLKNVAYAGYPVNKGKGGNLTNAFGHAHGTVQLFIDADLTIEKMLIPLLVNELKTADIAIASKHAHGARVAYPLLRKLTSWGFSAFSRLLFGIPIADFQCGLKAFRKTVLQELLPRMTEQGFLWDTELLVRAHRKHYKITEIPAIVHSEQGRQSKVRVFRDTWRMATGLLRLARTLNGERQEIPHRPSV